MTAGCIASLCRVQTSGSFLECISCSLWQAGLLSPLLSAAPAHLGDTVDALCEPASQGWECVSGAEGRASLTPSEVVGSSSGKCLDWELGWLLPVPHQNSVGQDAQVMASAQQVGFEGRARKCFSKQREIVCRAAELMEKQKSVDIRAYRNKECAEEGFLGPYLRFGCILPENRMRGHW